MKNIILWVILAFIWGNSYFAIKIGIETISPLTLVAGRMLIAAIILIVILYMSKLALPKDFKSWTILTVSGLMGSVIPFSLISFGEQYVESGLAALLMGIAPVVGILLAPLAHKDETLSKMSLIGVGFGVIGLFFLIGIDAMNGFGQHIWGQISILGAALCYSFTTLYVRKYANLPTMVMAAGSTLIGAVIICTAALVIDAPFTTLSPSATSLSALIYLGIFPTAMATWIYFYLMPKLGAARMSQINFLVPVVGAITGIVFLGELFKLNSFIALLFILAAIYFVSYKPAK